MIFTGEAVTIANASGQWSSPHQACRCARPREHYRLKRAYWDKCECCRVCTVRTAGSSWPSHMQVIIQCDGSCTKIDFFYERLVWGISLGQKVAVQRCGKANDLDSGVWSIVKCVTTEKSNATEIIDRARNDSRDPPDYNLIRDCHWYARGILTEAEHSGPCK